MHKNKGNKNAIKHGLSGSKLYRIYREILQRCNNKNHKFYNYYGGKGVKCEWLSFEDFYKDMAFSYQDGLTIERINSNSNYSKENCRWATPYEQARNRCSNLLVEVNGKECCVADACKMLNLKKQTVYTRIHRGMSPQKAIFK